RQQMLGKDNFFHGRVSVIGDHRNSHVKVFCEPKLYRTSTANGYCLKYLVEENKCFAISAAMHQRRILVGDSCSLAQTRIIIADNFCHGSDPRIIEARAFGIFEDAHSASLRCVALRGGPAAQVSCVRPCNPKNIYTFSHEQ